MKCALCLYRPFNSEVKNAITVISGIAVCYDHMGFVVNREFNLAMETARQMEKNKNEEI